MSLSRNHTALLKEIDTARCVGRWQALAALAAKYAKHNSAGQGFASIVACEARLEELLLDIPWDTRAHWHDEAAPVEGSANRLRMHFPKHLSAPSAALEPLEKEVRGIAGMALNDEERFQQRVIASKIRFYGGHYDADADADADAGADEESGSREPPTFVLSPAYGKQLAVARRVMRGVALERRGELAAARAEYARGVREFSACIDDAGCAVVVVPRSSGAHEELVNWPEEALYRRAMAG
ncbi:hypothetical protein LPJ66_011378, partial [Kickxella alabastrina]